MKNIFLAIVVLLASSSIFAQQGKNADEVVKFKELVYDFGKIKQGVPVTHDFEFTNTGAKPIVVENATASCGCTTPTWPQAPVAKGKTEKIKAGFNAAAPGAFTKQITVKFAGYDLPTQLTIKGEVLANESFSKSEKK